MYTSSFLDGRLPEIVIPFRLEILPNTECA